MSKKQKRKVGCENRKNTLQNNISVIDENTLTLAIVKAYQIIENEKRLEVQKKNHENKPREKWYIKILFILNVLIFPWKINKRYFINNKICDGILVIVVSLIFALAGMFIWITGLVTIINGIILVQGSTFIGNITLGLMLMMFGSLFTLASKEFSEASDSNMIYAYSASIYALIGCILTVISMIK